MLPLLPYHRVGGIIDLTGQRDILFIGLAGVIESRGVNDHVVNPVRHPSQRDHQRVPVTITNITVQQYSIATQISRSGGAACAVKTHGHGCRGEAAAFAAERSAQLVECAVGTLVETAFGRGAAGRFEQLDPPSIEADRLLSAGTNGCATRTERFSRRPTYEYQLEAFCAAVLRGETTLTPPADSIANMRVLDAIYVAAGMTPRGT